MWLSGVFYTYYLIHGPVGVGASAGFLFFKILLVPRSRYLPADTAD